MSALAHSRSRGARSRRSAAGFSLLELMVVVVITVVVTGHILSIFAGQLLTYEGQRAVTEVQDDARLAADMIHRDLRMSGFMVPSQAGVAAVDGGNTDPDMLCISDYTLLNETQIELATNVFDGAALNSDLGGSVGSVAIAAAERDIDGDGDNDFAVGAGLIIAEGTSTHCARILAVGATNITFQPDTPATFGATSLNGVAVPAILYARTAAGLTRNGLVVSRQVEDLQVEFAVDANDDGQIVGGEFPIHGLFGNDPTLVRLIRLSVLTRTVLEDPQLPDGGGRPAVANRAAAGAPDGFRRRLVVGSATPRNLL